VSPPSCLFTLVPSQALSVALRPSAVAPLATHVGWLVDDLWHLAGDTATDSAWYTKRASLAAVYLATELYMITDKSHGFQDTWAFLDRRMKVRAYVYCLIDRATQKINSEMPCYPPGCNFKTIAQPLYDDLTLFIDVISEFLD